MSAASNGEPYVATEEDEEVPVPEVGMDYVLIRNHQKSS
jgi:hypothetical protein